MGTDHTEPCAADALPYGGTIYLSAPAGETLCRLRAALAAAAITSGEPFPGVLTAPWSTDLPERFRRQVVPLMQTQDLQAVRCRVFACDVTPSLGDLLHMQSLEALLERVEGEWLIEVLRSARLMTYFQPIVEVGDPANIFAYECLLRGKQSDGTIIAPDRLFGAARATGLLYHLDRVARLTAIETAARSRISGGIFINFNPRSIYDPGHCLQSTVKAIHASGIAPERFVFEVVESEEITDPDRLLRIMDYYREAGLRVALDDLGAGYSSLSLLARLKPDYVKIDMDLVRNVDRDPYKSQVAGKLLEMAHELGVITIVEGVETVGEWQWSAEHGANYAQGYLFAPPQPWTAYEASDNYAARNNWNRPASFPGISNPTCEPTLVPQS